VAIISAVVWMVLTTIIYLIIRKKGTYNVVYSIVNSIMTGIAMSSYYSLTDITPYNSLLLMLVFTVITLVNYKVIVLIEKKELFVKVIIFIASIVMIGSIYIWVVYSLTLGSSLVFLFIIYLCFNISLLTVLIKKEQYIKILSFATFIMFGGILIAVIIALTEGDGVVIWDSSIFDGSKKKRA